MGTTKDAVVGDRRVAVAHLAVDSDAELCVLRVAEFRIVAASATDRTVARKSAVEIELTTELDLRPRQRIHVQAGDLTLPRRQSLGQYRFEDGVIKPGRIE